MIDKASIIALAFLLCVSAGAASAQETPTSTEEAAVPQITIELNNAADNTTGGCRLTFVAKNGTEAELERMAHRVAIFDANGVVTRLADFEFGAFPPGKTKIVQFVLDGGPCSDLSRIIMSDITACVLADGNTDDICMRGLEVTSRTPIELGL